MAVTLTNVETLVRHLIEDNSQSMIPGDMYTYEASAVFTLTESSVISVTSVFKNGVALTVTTDYTYDSTTNKVTVTASLTSGDTIEIQYTFYPNYSSTEIQNYVKGSIIHLSINNYYDFEVVDSTIYPEPEYREMNLIAIIAATLINPDNKSYRLPDITINVPNSLPTNDMINKIVKIFKHDVHGIFDIL